MPRISFACVCPGWQEGAPSTKVYRLGQQRVQQRLGALTKIYRQPKVVGVAFHLLSLGFSSTAFPLQPPCIAWQPKIKISFKICSRHVINKAVKNNTLRGKGWNNLWAKSSLVRWKFRGCHFAMVGHESGFEEHFAVMVAD